MGARRLFLDSAAAALAALRAVRGRAPGHTRAAFWGSGTAGRPARGAAVTVRPAAIFGMFTRSESLCPAHDADRAISMEMKEGWMPAAGMQDAERV